MLLTLITIIFTINVSVDYFIIMAKRSINEKCDGHISYIQITYFVQPAVQNLKIYDVHLYKTIKEQIITF